MAIPPSPNNMCIPFRRRRRRHEQHLMMTQCLFRPLHNYSQRSPPPSIQRTGRPVQCGHLWMEHRETRSAKISGRSKGSAGRAREGLRGRSRYSRPNFWARSLPKTDVMSEEDFWGEEVLRVRSRPELICGVSHMSRKIDKGRR